MAFVIGVNAGPQTSFKQALLNFDAGVASAGALFAVVLANIVAIFLIRLIGNDFCNVF